MSEDDLVAKYAAEAKAAMSAEANRRIKETTDHETEARLRSTSLLKLIGNSEFVPALLSRLGDVVQPLTVMAEESLFRPLIGLKARMLNLTWFLTSQEPVCHAALHPELWRE